MHWSAPQGLGEHGSLQSSAPETLTQQLLPAQGPPLPQLQAPLVGSQVMLGPHVTVAQKLVQV
jgi:hypothetical protein